MTALLIIFGVLQLVPIVVWAIGTWTIRQGDRALPDVSQHTEASPLQRDGGPQKLTIIIPAHNEAKRLPELLRRLRAQTYEPLEILISLDRSTDDSRAIIEEHAAEDPRVRFIEIHDRLEDWHAKCRPMHEGAAAATGDVFMFIDADTFPEPKLASAAMALAAERKWDLLSIMPQLRSKRFFELLLQPVATMQMLYVFPPYKVNRETDAKPFAVGPFMMVTREAYDAAGLMTSIKENIQDDLSLARAVHGAGRRGGIARPGGLFTAAMYESTRDFWVGWRRIYAGLLGFRVGRLRKHAARLLAFGILLLVAQIGGLLTGVVGLVTGHTTLAITVLIATALGLALQVAATGRYHRRGGGTPLLALLFPLGAITIGVLMLQSAHVLATGQPIRYAGRDYVIEPRD